MKTVVIVLASLVVGFILGVSLRLSPRSLAHAGPERWDSITNYDKFAGGHFAERAKIVALGKYSVWYSDDSDNASVLIAYTGTNRFLFLAGDNDRNLDPDTFIAASLPSGQLISFEDPRMDGTWANLAWSMGTNLFVSKGFNGTVTQGRR